MSEKCLVCDYEISEKNPILSQRHNEDTYYFCCPMCQATFTAIPSHFTKKVMQTAP